MSVPAAAAGAVGDQPRTRWSPGSRLSWLLLAWLAWALLGLLWTPYDPRAQTWRDQALAGASAAHWLGLDGLGRDVLSRVWRGSGNTVLFGAAAAASALLLAVLLLAAEQKGPRAIRHIVRALVSASLAMPVFLVGLVLMVFLPQSPPTLVLACALGGAPLAFRQLRAIWIEQAGALHVLASRALGATRRHLLWFALWPNLRPQIAGLIRLLFAIGVLELSGLSFLGLVGDPNIEELGAMLRQNQSQLFRVPALVIWPGIFLSGLLLVVHASGQRRAGPGLR